MVTSRSDSGSKKKYGRNWNNAVQFDTISHELQCHFFEVALLSM